jgi:hypothetical protein
MHFVPQLSCSTSADVEVVFNTEKLHHHPSPRPAYSDFK